MSLSTLWFGLGRPRYADVPAAHAKDSVVEHSFQTTSRQDIELIDQATRIRNPPYSPLDRWMAQRIHTPRNDPLTAERYELVLQTIARDRPSPPSKFYLR